MFNLNHELLRECQQGEPRNFDLITIDGKSYIMGSNREDKPDFNNCVKVYVFPVAKKECDQIVLEKNRVLYNFDIGDFIGTYVQGTF